MMKLRLAVLGDPLEYTLSPELHRAGLEAVGCSGESHAIRTPPELLGRRLRELALEAYRGVNLTAPLKEVALGYLAHLSEAAHCARSVNTVGFDREGWWGETTDGAGFVELLGSLGRRPSDQRALLMGGGGAARSIAWSLIDAGCDEVTVSARRPREIEASWAGMTDARITEWRSDEEARALGRATVVVNATPLAGEEGPMPAALLPRSGVVIDLRYGSHPTRWIRACRDRGLEAYDGLGLLVFQARRSLSLWTGRDVPLDPLARAVGWPR